MKLSIFFLTALSGGVFAQAQQPLGGTAQPPSGGGTAQPPSGGTAKPPSGGTAQPPSGGTAQPPGGGSAQPPSGGTAKPPSGGTAQPPSGGGTAQPPSGGTAQPPSGGGTAQPPSGGGTAQPPSGGGTAQPPSGGGTAQPPSGGGTAQPPSGGTGQTGGGNTARPPGGNTSQPPTPASFSCPKDDGALYTTGGITYQLKCGHGTTAQRQSFPDCYNQKQCADLCAADPKCQSCDWNVNLNKCAIFYEYIPTFPMAGVNTWFPLEQRPDPPPPFCPVKPAPVQPAGVVDNADCPGADGKVYANDQGFFFKVYCNFDRGTPNPFQTTTVNSYNDCINVCTTTTYCKSVRYHRQTGGCELFDEGEELSPGPCPNKDLHDVAIFTDPPTIPTPPETLSERCASDCPGAHGKTYTSKTGETFIISCCQRHAVKPLGKVHAQSIGDCIDECSKFAECSSVDFQINTEICFLLNKHSPPGVETKAFASAVSLGCSDGCKKDGCCNDKTT